MAKKLKQNLFDRPGSGRIAGLDSSGPDVGAFVLGLVSWLMFLGLASVIFAVISIGLMSSYRLIARSSFFAFTDIEVQGTERLSPAQVLETAGVNLGQNALALRMEEVRSRLLTNPWIADAAVRRELPGTLVMEITERKPEFWANRDGTMYYVDREGYFIAPVGSKDVMPLPLLKAEDGAQASLDRLGQVIADVQTEDLPFRLAEADWLRLDAHSGLELAFGQPQRRLVIDMRNFSENLNSVSRAWKDLSRRGEWPSVLGMRAYERNVWVRMGAQ